jgi:hypothetical protein
MTISAAWRRPGRSHTHRPPAGGRIISGCAAVVLAAVLPLASGIAPAAAGTTVSTTVGTTVSTTVSTTVGTTAARQLYQAGYHFAAPRGPALTVHGAITVPRVSCNTGAFGLAPQILVRYYVGTGLKVASASLALTCDFGIPIYGNASLLVNNRTKVVPHPLRPGQTVAVTVTIRRSAATVQISYPGHSSATLRGAGGRPFDGQFSAAMARPPRYAPISFTGCRVDGRTLAAVRPGAWIAVDRHNHVIGRPSRLSHGTNFTITA